MTSLAIPGSAYELVREERNRVWITQVTFRFWFEVWEQQKTIGRRTRFDRDTGIENLDNWIASLFHDVMHEDGRWDDGTPCELRQADYGYLALVMLRGTPTDKGRILRLFPKLRLVGWAWWYKNRLLQWWKERVCGKRFEPYKPCPHEDIITISVPLGALKEW